MSAAVVQPDAVGGIVVAHQRIEGEPDPGVEVVIAVEVGESHPLVVARPAASH